MKKRVLLVVSVLALLVSSVAGTLLVSLAEANPLWFIPHVQPDETTKPPVISIFSPENNTVYNTDTVVLSFNVDAGESETASTVALDIIWYDTSWYNDNVDSFLYSPRSPVNTENKIYFSNSSSFAYNLSLTGIPDGNHGIILHAKEHGYYEDELFINTSSEKVSFTVDANQETDQKTAEYFLADDYVIVPEFPSWTILPLFLTIVLAVALYRKRLPKTKPTIILGY